MRMVICEKPGREHWHEGPEVVCNDGESIGRPALSSSDPKSHPHPRSLLSSQTKKKDNTCSIDGTGLWAELNKDATSHPWPVMCWL